MQKLIKYQLKDTLHYWSFPVASLLYVSSLQPVHNNGSSGYGSLGSNGSHEHYISIASSSDSNGNLWEDPHREPVRRHSKIISPAALFCVTTAEVNPVNVLCVCICVISDDFAADLCWCEQS